jgi:hypothetical protein
MVPGTELASADVSHGAATRDRALFQSGSTLLKN